MRGNTTYDWTGSSNGPSMGTAGYGHFAGSINGNTREMSKLARGAMEAEARNRQAGQFHNRSPDGRRANLAYGADISQKYDAFGNNSFSQEDNPWAGFFGAPSAPWKTTSYDEYDRGVYNLPDAYQGKNETISQTIDELIYSDETYYTSILLPFNFTNNISIVWDKWEFNEHFTGIVPEQGVSRLVSSKRSTYSESFYRRGLAAMFEHGFMTTPEGRANYFLTLAQIARAVQETLNFGVIYAYLTCHNYNKEWEAKHGYFRRSTLMEILERDNFMWAIAIKAEMGLEKLDAQITDWMNRYRSSADTWILPPKPAMYLSMVPAEKVYYYLGGDKAADRANGISTGVHEANAPSKRVHDVVEPYAVFKKNRVFLTRTYHIDRTGPIDLMARTSTVGEYFKVVNTMNDADFREGFLSCYLDTRVYNEEGDRGYTVKNATCLKYSMVFKADGTPNGDFADSVDPYDSNDMDQVFFLRGETTPSGGKKYVPIRYMGDIDPAFFRPSDAANLARTAIASLFRDQAERSRLSNALSAGKRLIDRLAMLPVNTTALDATDKDTFAATAGGMVTFAGLNAIATSVGAAPEVAIAAAYIAALKDIANRIGSVLGGNGNIFLKPENALPMYSDTALPADIQAAASPERVLHENLFAYRAIPLYTIADTAAPVFSGAAGSAATAIYAKVIEAFNGSLLKDKDLAAKGLTKADRDAVSALIVNVSKDAAGLKEAINVLKANVRYTAAPSEGALLDWINKLEKATLAGVAEVSQKTTPGTQGTRGATITDMAIYPENPDAKNDVLFKKGLAMASAFDVTMPRQVTAGYQEDGAFKPSTFIGDQPRFQDMPIVQALLNAEQEIGAGIGSRSGAGAGGRGAYASRGGLASFDDEPIGSSYNDYDGAAIDANRRFLPNVGYYSGAEGVSLRFGTMAVNLDQLANLPMDGLERAVAIIYYGTEWRRENLENMDSHNIMQPVGYLGFRIGRYDMALGIKCKAGGSTGYTYFGHSDFMLADDASIKMHYGHYTHYGKSVIHNPEQVFVAYDIFPNRCLGGMGIVPYTSRRQFIPADSKYEADIFYVMVPYTETEFDKVMSMAGRFYTYMDAGMIDETDPLAARLHYTTAPYYNRIWGWYSQEDVPIEIDEPLYRISSPGVHLTVWQGAQGSYNPATKLFNKEIIRNTSPWGENVYQGVRACRNGMMERMKVVPMGELGF